MDKKCIECPYARTTGGYTKGFPNHPQPCHMHVERACIGHTEALEDGKIDLSGDCITFNLSGTEVNEDTFLIVALREHWEKNNEVR